ncbi:MFS transporter [Bacillus sp. ISL-41]|uniref:MFS transporter n=1 Tax=Bacillus sp. ISL-41 TaxID=2819127 RepID=UPI001BE75F68|nr:MFS transporter [Bacillus sp. ISL-41]MBT2643437.1 MFS transporter [Bacillus sp. ISL-41]
MEFNNKHTIIAISLITAIFLAGDAMLYIVLPTHWKEAGLTSLVQVGILLSVNRFVRLPLNPLIGYMYKRINFRTGILLAVILSGITTVCYGFAQDFTVWVILRSIWGLAWSLFKLGAFLLILQLATDSNRGNYVGTYNGLYRLGSLVGMLIGGFFADLFGIKAISIIIGTSALLSIPIIFKYIPRTIQTNEASEKKLSLLTNFNSFLNSRLIMILGTAFLLVMLLDGMITATLSHIIEIKYTDRINLLGIIVGAATLAGLIQALRWGLAPIIVMKIGTALDKTNQKNRILSFFLVCAALLYFIIPKNVPLLVWMPILLVHLLIASVLTTIMDAIITDYSSRVINKVFIMTSFTLIVDLGAALGPIIGYSLEQKIGLTNLFGFSGVVCFFLAVVWLFSRNVSSIKNLIHQSS